MDSWKKNACFFQKCQIQLYLSISLISDLPEYRKLQKIQMLFKEQILWRLFVKTKQIPKCLRLFLTSLNHTACGYLQKNSVERLFKFKWRIKSFTTFFFLATSITLIYFKTDFKIYRINICILLTRIRRI